MSHPQYDALFVHTMCDTIVIVRHGNVLFAKNSDRDPNEAQYLDWQPRKRHPVGSRVKCTWIEIPQVPETNSVLLSRPFWMWGAEIGANEHGLTIGNEAVFTREPYAKIGLTGMDLVRLALERAADARQAANVIVDLIREFGQGGGCGLENRRFTYHNSFLIADPQGALVLETAGRHHAVETVVGARSISNGLTISDFARHYAEPLRTRVAGCKRRQQRTQALANRADGPADLMAILSDHDTSGDASQLAHYWPPHYSFVRGGLGAPCVHAGGLVAASQTTASWVAELRPEACTHWVTATAAPCLSLFKPVRVDRPLNLGPTPTDRADPKTLWWRHEWLHRAIMRDPLRVAADFWQERAAIQRRWLDQPPDPMQAFTMSDAFVERWTRTVLDEPMSDSRPRFVRRYWSKRNATAGLALELQARFC